MKKFLVSLILLIFIVLISLLIALSTLGIETKKFNQLISNKAVKTKNIFFIVLKNLSALN